MQTPPIPWKSIAKSLPFWAILLAHMGHNYGYETLMTELPTYMQQVLHFSIKDVRFVFISRGGLIKLILYSQNGFLSALPYLAMWIFSIFISHVADWLLTKPHFTHTIVRKLINGIGKLWLLLVEVKERIPIKCCFLSSFASNLLMDK